MKKCVLFIGSIVMMFLSPNLVFAIGQVVTVDVQQVNVDLSGGAVVLGQITVNAPEAGSILLDFSGNCVSAAGDRILLAASNSMGWSVNDGHVAVEAYDADITRHSFSHTRRYAVAAGSTTFYAVGQNFVETDGTGIASVYGNLTARYFPDNEPAFSMHTGIVEVNRDLNSGVEEIASISANIPSNGKVLVKFNGMCVSDPGDLIVIAASNNVGWSVNDGNTGVEAIDDDLNTRVFSHSRVYDVTPGMSTFYAVAQNFVETEGDGIASFYASLSIVFIPDGTNYILSHEGVIKTNIDVEGDPVVMGSVTIDAAVSGVAVVTYDGLCASSPGDRIVMAASNTGDWSPNAGNVNVEAISADLNYNNFSHTRTYAIEAGSHTYNAICENFVETEGTGLASNYASLTVQFFPSVNVVSVQDLADRSYQLILSPNPASDVLHVGLEDFPREKMVLTIFDTSGRLMVEKSLSEESSVDFDLNNFAAGNYFLRVQGKSVQGVRQFTVY